MRLIVTATFVLALALAAFGRDIPERVDTRIIGGSDAPSGSFPYTVSLRKYFEHFCGGSILNNRWVLTSAECIVNKYAHEISVIAGTHFLSEAGQMYQAILKISHPRYNATERINDIGLILVSRTIVFTDRIQPIPMPIQNFNEADYPAVFSGWGVTQVNGPYAQYLQMINLRVISQTVCASRESRLRPSQICTLTQVGEGVCRGDTGGPLVADGIQIGISSFGNECAGGNPDIFTRVWSFVEWIRTTIATNNPAI